MIGSSVFAQLVALSENEDIPDLQQPDGTYRIFPNYVHMADKNYPQLVYDCENFDPDYALDGSDGIPTIDVKILAVGETYADADALGKAVANALDGTRGTWGSTIIRGCFLKGVDEQHFVDTDLETILYFTKELTFEVIFEQ